MVSLLAKIEGVIAPDKKRIDEILKEHARVCEEAKETMRSAQGHLTIKKFVNRIEGMSKRNDVSFFQRV